MNLLASQTVLATIVPYVNGNIGDNKKKCDGDQHLRPPEKLLISTTWSGALRYLSTARSVSRPGFGITVIDFRRVGVASFVHE